MLNAYSYMNIKTIVVSFLFLISFVSSHVDGAIYICLDNKGIKHYSDKKCPIKKTVKTVIIKDLGKTSIPNSILEFTPIIQNVKAALRFIKELIPDNELYQTAYGYTLTTERSHNNYIATKHRSHPKIYSPFDPIKLEHIVAAISHACRAEANMTICGVIESNYWLSGEEQIYLKNQIQKDIHLRVTAIDKNKLCEKAKLASQSGVISRKMVDNFCLEK